MKKFKMLIMTLTFSFLALSCIAVERVGSAQWEFVPDGGGAGGENLACNDLTACMNTQSCGMRGTPNGCTLTCQDETVITCPKKTN